MSKVIPVVLSGGSGSRLWPKSRHHYPKQLHCLFGQKTMLQETLSRVSHLGERPIVICNQDQRFMVADQLHELEMEGDIVLEPMAKNTAPAIAVAALMALEVDENAIIAVFPADHLIKNQKAFDDSLEAAIRLATEGKLVTFGIVPSRPETGYGYIKAQCGGEASAKVEEFVEKPSLEVAEKYLDAGCYFWNSGMFVFNAKTLISEIDKNNSNIVRPCRDALDKANRDLDFLRLDSRAFSCCDNISIDYAVMERTNEAFVVPMNAEWSDVGSWQALWEVGEKDKNNNVCIGDVFTEASKGCYVNSEARLVALVGVEDLVVVETADSVLVANKNSSQDVKNIVNRLKTEQRSEYLSHREVHRPWGSYDLVDAGNRFHVKRIKVKPGESLSLHMHHHRAEHWVVVAGTAQISLGDKVQILTENQSVFVPLGQTHRLSNPGKVPLYLIEIASGAYLDEDDMVRFEDGYGRV